MLNPGNSIKDRIAIAMIDAAEQDGSLKPGGHIVEAFTGQYRYRTCVGWHPAWIRQAVVIPDKMSEGKISHLRAMGIEVIMARSTMSEGASGLLPGSGRRHCRRTWRLLCQPVLERSKRHRPLRNHRTTRRSGNRPTARSMRSSWPASAPAERSPESDATFMFSARRRTRARGSGGLGACSTGQ